MNPFGIVFRRIIYAIPLKVLLLLLAVFGVFFACFSSALNVDGWIVNFGFNNGDKIHANNDVNFVCFKTTDTSCTYLKLTEVGNTSNYVEGNPVNTFLCLKYNSSNDVLINTSKTCNYSAVRMNIDTITDEYCPVMSSLECQTLYSLIPVSSVDQNYCTTNNLCPTYDCPTNPIGTGTLSNLYINNILHIGAPNIIMNIPEEIDWDYAYTMGGNTMNIDIVGYNQDIEKIQGWIDTNNYKPTSDDFTNIFKNFSNFGGLLVGALFVILVFYFVKKMFK